MSGLDSSALAKSGYSDWEISIVQSLHAGGGAEGAASAGYIVENNIRIKVGKPFAVRKALRRDAVSGDWESLFPIGAWWKGRRFVVLNPNAGYQQDTPPGLWGISLVAHEAVHISQGWRARTKRGEMEAWQFGLKVYKNLGGNVGTGRNYAVLAAKTVDEFVEAIKTFQPEYWKGLRLYPPWVPPYDKFP